MKFKKGLTDFAVKHLIYGHQSFGADQLLSTFTVKACSLYVIAFVQLVPGRGTNLMNAEF